MYEDNLRPTNFLCYFIYTKNVCLDMFFSLFRQREETKRDHVARFDADKM